MLEEMPLSEAQEIFEIESSISLGQLKQKYRHLCKNTHPDVQRASSSADHFQKVKEAYETLLRYCESYAIPLPTRQLQEASLKPVQQAAPAKKQTTAPLDPATWWNAKADRELF